MSFSAFLTGTVLVSSLALTGLLAAPHEGRNPAALAWAGGLALIVVGFVGGWFLAG